MWTEGRCLKPEEIERQLNNPQTRNLSQRVPLTDLIQVLDVVWQGEGTL